MTQDHESCVLTLSAVTAGPAEPLAVALLSNGVLITSKFKHEETGPDNG
jgi:hypothetical protein